MDAPASPRMGSIEVTRGHANPTVLDGELVFRFL